MVVMSVPASGLEDAPLVDKPETKHTITVPSDDWRAI